MIAEDASRIICQELLPEEELLWADKPRQVPVAMYYWCIFLLLFFLVPFIGPLAYALTSGDLSFFDSYTLSVNGERITSTTSVSTLWSALITTIIMLLFFIAFVAGWLLIKMMEVYGITNRRVIIVSRFPQRRISSINPAMTPYIERSGNQNIGSILFRGTEHGLFDKILAVYRVRLQSFMSIRNPKDVEALIYKKFIHDLEESQRK